MAGEWVMKERELERCIARLAHEISERSGDPLGYVLVGVVTGGERLAERLADAIARIDGRRPRTGSVDITLYRDDLYTGLEKPVLGETRLPFELSDTLVVLVDDVCTGRTVRAALDEIMDWAPRHLPAVLVTGAPGAPHRADFVAAASRPGRATGSRYTCVRPGPTWSVRGSKSSAARSSHEAQGHAWPEGREPRGDHAHPRPGAALPGRQPAPHQEGPDPPRANGRHGLLRELHPHEDELRARGEAP